MWNYLNSESNKNNFEGMINQFLDSSLLEEWIEKVNKDKDNF